MKLHLFIYEVIAGCDRKAEWGLFACVCFLGACAGSIVESPESEASTGTESAALAHAGEAAEAPEAAPAPSDPVAAGEAGEPSFDDTPVEAPAAISPAPPAYAGPEARICGCGCCMGITTSVECVANETLLRRRVAADRRSRNNLNCAWQGCSTGTVLRVCTAP